MIAEIKKRRAVREYQDMDVPDSYLRQLIEAALMAPSPFNRQPWRFHVIRDKGRKTAIRSIYDDSTRKIQLYRKLYLTRVPIYEQDTGFLEAATLIVPCYETGISYARDSLAMAVQNMMLEAASCNIASVCMGRPTRFKSQREKMRKVARVEKGYEVPYIIAVGFAPKPNEQYEVPERKKYDQVTIQL